MTRGSDGGDDEIKVAFGLLETRRLFENLTAGNPTTGGYTVSQRPSHIEPSSLTNLLMPQHLLSALFSDAETKFAGHS